MPLNLSNFPKLITGGYIYVDKTHHIYNIVKDTKFHFLSRPRRFGKSLLISTLKEIFSGKKELFDNLWIAQSDYDWTTYPVMLLDFSALGSSSAPELKTSLLKRLSEIAEECDVEVEKEDIIEDMTRGLIKELSKKYTNIVLLVDEYDHPLLKHIDDPETAKSILEVLKSFYHVIKSSSGKFKSIFVTGVTKFSKASLFSGLNNLQDITLDHRYASLLGYTAEELDHYFENYIDYFAEKSCQSYDDALDNMRSWYNGYQFSIKAAKVYNPFSVLYFLDKGELENYWFETGTPSFLVNLIKTYQYPVQNLSGAQLNTLDMGTFEIGKLPIVPIFFQSGYLTITDYDPNTKNYTLDYPNREVEASFLSYFLNDTTSIPIASVTNYVFKLTQAIENNNINQFCSLLQQFLSTIPYDIHVPLERYYQTIFYVIVQLIGSYIAVEVKTNIGRIDAVIQTKTHIYIFELKIDSTGQQALQQIEDKKYYERFLGLNKIIELVGLSFSTQEKNITPDWVIKVL